MRIELTIDHLPNQKLPINYPYLISSWIYHTLHRSDADFSKWLHERGYEINGRKYKHFCFSMLRPQRFKIYSKEQIFELQEAPTRLILSFNIDQGAKNMVKSLFQNNLMELKSGTHFKFLGMVNQVQLQALSEWQKQMRYRAQTPICISVGTEGDNHAEYLHPTDTRYAEAFISNLVDKANAYLGEKRFAKEEVQFKLLTTEPKAKLWKIKQTKVKGYLFDFELSAPKELQEIGYLGGFGTMNASLGMGYCEVI